MVRTDIVELVTQAVRYFAKEMKTPIIKISLDGDGKSCEVIIDVETHNPHSKDAYCQSFVISSACVKEIPYDESSN